MQIPFIKGKVALQAHVGIPEGTVEEEYARSGFTGRYAHLYRSRPLVEWDHIDGPLKPEAFDLNLLEVEKRDTNVNGASNTSDSGDYLQSRKILLQNDDVRIAFATIQKEMHYFFRNADSDEVHFIHSGHGLLETDFGPIKYESGDYIIIPRGTTYRFDPNPKQESRILLIESSSEIQFPEKGLLGQHALFDPAMLRVPTPEPSNYSVKPGGRFEIRVKRSDKITRVQYSFNPLNVVGWKGTLSVYQINVRDIRPISSDRYHLPPSAHVTFVAHGFVICTFLPRPLENGDPMAMKVPFYHQNIDFDEVLFYHSGEFFSRSGIKEGMMTFHPQGIQHGPQKKAVERTKEARKTDEVAVMIDTRRPLEKTEWSTKIEIENYWKSWQ